MVLWIVLLTVHRTLAAEENMLYVVYKFMHIMSLHYLLCVVNCQISIFHIPVTNHLNLGLTASDLSPGVRGVRSSRTMQNVLVRCGTNRPLVH